MVVVSPVPTDNSSNLSDDLCLFVFACQGEEGPPSLEYIKAKDLFPQKELVKEDESLQVSPAAISQHKQELAITSRYQLVFDAQTKTASV